MRVLSISLFIAFLLVVIGFLGFLMIFDAGGVMAASGNEPVSIVEIDIYGPPAPIIQIQVPDLIDLGNISYNGDGTRTRVDINNSGNVAVNIKPVLVNSSDEVFSNLYFERRTTDVYSKIGNWSINITAPTSGVDGDYFYMKLDLRNYNGNINSDLLNQRSNVKFVATQA
jgi:hypothetical protein